MSRIDYCLISETVVPMSFETEVALFSNHRVIKVEVELNPRSKYGREVWKLNTRLLEEKRVIERFESFFNLLI